MHKKGGKSGKTSLAQRKGLSEEDYYLNDSGLMVFTEQYHLKRGYCCKNGCRHCPYGFTTRVAGGAVKPESE
ncbi:DUF5522 domain-containing protein [Telluribacter humicola]|uniref:DUF5522 domain-containing protein n=1 Tax=Telluribacter humicola TaxID=1720261 RepID=UPI001A96D853|nr:DUF5522 domain-containing protein [Telluribacter humicola]